MIIRLKGDEKLRVVDYRKKQQTRATEIKYGLELALVLEFYHDNDSAFTEEELSIYTSFQFAIDADFDFTTNPPVLANNETTTFVISGNTISFTAMTDTAAFKALIGGSPSAEAYAEFKAYKPGKARPGLAPVFKVMAYNAVAADGSEVPSASPELYITTAEAYALVQEAPGREFSVDGATLWHVTQVTADRYYREQRNGGAWSAAINMIEGAPGGNTYLYVAYASNNVGTDFSLSPSALRVWRVEIQSSVEIAAPVLADFVGGTWSRYLGASSYEMWIMAGNTGTEAEYLASLVGETGAAGTGVLPQGTYAAGTTYAINEGVTYNGSYYRSKVADNIGNQPDTSATEWEQMISIGATGPAAKRIIKSSDDLAASTVELDAYIDIYTKTVATATTFVFDTSGLTLAAGDVITFELHIDMTTVSTLTFPASVSWIDTPLMNDTKTYVLVFRSTDAGTNWLGNLAYEVD